MCVSNVRALTGIWLVLWFSATGTIKAADWPQWRGPNRDGISDETEWTTRWPEGGSEVLWEANVGKGFSSVSVADGRLYTMGNVENTDAIWCLDAATGRNIWKHTYPCPASDSNYPVKYPGTRMTPTVHEGKAYTISRVGDVFCLSAAGGQVRWSVNVEKEHGARQTKWRWGFSCSPIVVGDLVIFDVGTVLAFQKDTGRLEWRALAEKAGYASPRLVKAGGKTYVTAFNEAGFALISMADGKVAARYPWKTDWGINAATPVVSGDSMLISSAYGAGCALLQASGGGLKTVYRNKDLQSYCRSGVLRDGYLYGDHGKVGQRGLLKCLDFETGRVAWRQGGFRVGGGLMIAAGEIIHFRDGGELVIAEASPERYKELARAEVIGGRCWTHPVLSGGLIYCRNAAGKLVCLDVRAGG